jgi:hypothetical protein
VTDLTKKYYAEGSTDWAEVKFFHNGVFPDEGGYRIRIVSPRMDGLWTWQRPIRQFCFMKEHLKAVHGEGILLLPHQHRQGMVRDKVMTEFILSLIILCQLHGFII